MISRVSTAALSCFILLSGMSGAQAFSIPEGTAKDQGVAFGTGCQIYGYMSNNNVQGVSGYLQVGPWVGRGFAAGVSYHLWGTADSNVSLSGTGYNPTSGGIFGPITETYLETKCGLTNVTNLDQGFVGGPAYKDASRLFISFRAEEDGKLYDYFGELNGVTDSSVTATKTEVIANVEPPTVTLSGAPATYSGTSSFSVTATFSADMTGFDDPVADIRATNASVAIGGADDVYTLTVTPDGAGDISLMVRAGAAKGPDETENLPSNTVEITELASEPEAQKHDVSDFLQTRNGLLASNQPGVTRFLQDQGCGAFSASASDSGSSASGCVQNGYTWTDFTGSWTDAQSYTLVTIGAHHRVGPDTLAGVMIQVDNFGYDAGNTSGSGWMAGPYFATRLAGQKLYLEGRLLYGQTDNTLTPDGADAVDFETERWLTQLRMSGEYQLPHIILTPLADLTYSTDCTRNTPEEILGSCVGLTQVSAGLDFKTPLDVSVGVLELQGGLSGIYAETWGGQSDFEGGRGRAHLGVNYSYSDSLNIGAGMFYDGIGIREDAWGGRLTFDLKF